MTKSLALSILVLLHLSTVCCAGQIFLFGSNFSRFFHHVQAAYGTVEITLFDLAELKVSYLAEPHQECQKLSNYETGQILLEENKSKKEDGDDILLLPSEMTRREKRSSVFVTKATAGTLKEYTCLTHVGVMVGIMNEYTCLTQGSVMVNPINDKTGWFHIIATVLVITFAFIQCTRPPRRQFRVMYNLDAT